jgi:hypothetical protein
MTKTPPDNLRVRLPSGLKRAIERAAAKNFRSINAEIIASLTAVHGAEVTHEDAADSDDDDPAIALGVEPPEQTGTPKEVFDPVKREDLASIQAALDAAQNLLKRKIK